MNNSPTKLKWRTGLSEAEAIRSRETYGANTLSKRPSKSFGKRFLSNLGDPVIRVLLAALAVHLLLLFRTSDWVETAGIAFAVLLATLISTLSEQSSERAFLRLSAEGEKGLCRVIRDGETQIKPIRDVVVGDLLRLGAGEAIPADGELLEGTLRTDQSSMTGESREISKHPARTNEGYSHAPDCPCALFRGCTVTEGEGLMEVREVGDNSFLGHITREIQTEQRESPLRVRLAKLAGQISKLGYLAAVLVALAYLVHVFLLDSGMRPEVIALKLLDWKFLLHHLFHAFTLGLTVVVTAVPEGLPMMVAVVLSANTKRMVRDKVLVRKPVGIEAAGSMDLLFTDKTGTLTEGNMKLTEWLLPTGEAVDPKTFLTCNSPTSRLVVAAFRSGDASVGSEKGRQIAVGGNATARALLTSVFSAPLDFEVLSRLPFDSNRKFAAATVKGVTSSPVTLLVGAPELLLERAVCCMDTDGNERNLSIRPLKNAISERTAEGARVVAVARAIGREEATRHASGIASEVALLGLAVLTDPLRREASESVKALQGAGVSVVMITGDGKGTAQAIARACGILTEGRHLILESRELALLSDMELLAVLPHLAAVARALPTDKSRLVRVAQESGRVVGMTGDGINDAPALRRADIGFAMGSGTQVAKDAGDIILLDNRLSSVVRAVLYGRTIFKSIRKFITLQLTMNFCAVGVTMLGPFLGFDSPVTVVQMLWINLIMDTLGGLAFAGEPPLERVLSEKPKKRDAGILNRYMVNEIAFLGSMTVALLLAFLRLPFFTSHFRFSTDRIYLLTAFFALFIFASVWNCFNARSEGFNPLRGLRKNRVFLLIMGGILVIQIGFVYLGGSVLRTAPLTPRELFFTFLLSLSVFPAEWIRKLFWRIRGKKSFY